MHVALENAAVSGKGEETMDLVRKLQQELKESRQEIAKKNAEIKHLEKLRITKKLCASFRVLEEERLRLKEENELYKQRLAEAEEETQRSQTVYSLKVYALLDELKAEMNQKDDRIITLTKEVFAALLQVEEVRAQMKKDREEYLANNSDLSLPATQLQAQVKELKLEISKRDGRIIRLAVGLSSTLDKVEEERVQLMEENEIYRKQLANFQDSTFRAPKERRKK